MTAEVRRDRVPEPLFSICVPQYNRTSHLLEGLKTLASQSFRDFEVCISDDCSTDGRAGEILEFLEAQGLSFVYRRRETNGRYDANLRSALALARGRYSFLLGNDDCLASPSTLEEIRDDLAALGPAGLVVTNYADFVTGRPVERVRRTAHLGSGPTAAAGLFRNLAFVSGLLLDTEAAATHATAEWDGSEMYQVFLGCRIVATGAPALGLRRVTVRKDVRVEGERVESYASRPREAASGLRERRIPLTRLGSLVAAAVAPACPPGIRTAVGARILAQLLGYTYPFWIVEYRRVQSWRFALEVCLAMRVGNVARGVPLTRLGRLGLRALHATVTVLGLTAPIRLFDRLYPTLHAVAKRTPGAPRA